MRVAGTRNPMASAFTESPSGFRNSSASTSPGWVVTRLGVETALMVVDDFDIFGSLLRPYEANAPLIVRPINGSTNKSSVGLDDGACLFFAVRPPRAGDRRWA